MIDNTHNKTITIRLVFILLLILMLFLMAVVTMQKSFAASLKSIAVINDEIITLGDLFDNVGKNADYAIGPAPQPGQDMTLNARTLYRIASALDMEWRPNSNADQITIRRDATIINYNMIKASLDKALIKKGVSGAYDLQLTGRKPSIILPNNIAGTVAVTALTYDRNRDYFTATLVAPSQDNPIKKIEISGLIDRLASVPVLMSNLQNGDIIGENDIEMIQISQSDIQPNMIVKKDVLLGLTPRRAAYAGKFLQKGGFIRPQLVERGESVSITFTEGPLVLTAKGKALQSGAKGDTVRVTNASSSRTVDAIVSGSNEVVVR